VLVATVLRPEQRKDGELEMVRLAAQELLDSAGFPVRETEGPMERLFRDLCQVMQSSRPSGGLFVGVPLHAPRC